MFSTAQHSQLFMSPVPDDDELAGGALLAGAVDVLILFPQSFPNAVVYPDG